MNTVGAKRCRICKRPTDLVPEYGVIKVVDGKVVRVISFICKRCLFPVKKSHGL